MAFCPDGEKLLRVCSYLDPRFKDLSFFSESDRADIKKHAKALCLEMAAGLRLPLEVSVSRAAAKRASAVAELAAKDAAVAAAQALVQSGDVPLSSLASGSSSGGRGRGRGGRGGRGRKPPISEAVVVGGPPKGAIVTSQDAEFDIKDLFNVQAPTPAAASKKVIDLQVLLRRELEAYDKEAQADFFEDPAAWWQSRTAAGILGTHVSLLARHCLGIPGSSALLERCFSHAGRAVTPKRARLSSKHAMALIFVHENVRQGLL